MQSHRLYIYILMLCALAGCLLIVPANADDTIPWLTGDFEQSTVNQFSTQVNPSQAIMSFNPILGDASWTWYGDCNNACWGIGIGPIIGGSASGVLYDWTNNQTESFTGSITGGGFTEQADIQTYNQTANYFWRYGYSFVGVWTNQWHTVGSIASQTGTEGGDYTWASITTSTPEPGTIALLSAGIVCGWRSWRKRNLLRR